MNTKKLLSLVLGAFVSFSATSHSAVVNLNGLGDVYLGLDNNGNGGAGNFKSVLFDLGSVSQLLSQADFNNPLTIDQSAAGSVLNTVFGPSWQTNSSITWWAFAGVTPTNSMYLGSPVGSDPFSDGTVAGGAIVGIGNASKNAVNLSMSGMTAEMNNTTRYTLGTLTGTGKGGSFTFVSSTDKGSPTAFQTGSWGELIDNGSTASSIQNNLGPQGTAFFDGTSYTGLGLYQYTNSGSSYNANFAAPAYFNVNSSGVITVVPEPSTNALLAIAGLGMIVAVARRMRARQEVLS